MADDSFIQGVNADPTDDSFRDKVVLVTGAARGIGRAVAFHYAKVGARVTLWDKDERTLTDTMSLNRDLLHDADSAVVDVSQPGQIEAGVAAISQRWGKIDILINNAGISRWQSPLALSVSDWDEVLNVNLRGTFLCAREAAHSMPAGGAIVNIASTRGIMSEPNSEAYAASKGGILALTHALAASFAPQRIRVNAISPGWIETGDYDTLKPADHEQHFSGRVGKPEDIARACAYLTHPANDFVSGINLVVDGGMTRKMIYVE